MGTKKATKKVKPEAPSVDLLKSWQGLNKHIKTLTEAEAGDLLEAEKKGKRRLGFLMRLYGRFNTLRTIRERQELAAYNINL